MPQIGSAGPLMIVKLLFQQYSNSQDDIDNTLFIGAYQLDKDCDEFHFKWLVN